MHIDKKITSAESMHYLKLCVDITVYWSGSIFNRVEGVLNFYQHAVNIIGDSFTYYETETMGEARPIDRESLDLIPFWFSKSKFKREMYILRLESGSAPNVPSDKAFYLRAIESEDKVGGMRLVLPVDILAEPVTTFVELTKSLVQGLEFSSGHAGYAINWNERECYEAESLFYFISRRYQGIDIPDLASTLFGVADGIKSVNWLTLLNKSYCEKLGGIENLRKYLRNEVIVHPLENGILIQAGPKPSLGDVNAGDKLPEYHKVGEVLAPIRMTEHPAFIMHGEDIYDELITNEWLSRFDS